jgi:hypothetical protein
MNSTIVIRKFAFVFQIRFIFHVSIPHGVAGAKGGKRKHEHGLTGIGLDIATMGMIGAQTVRSVAHQTGVEPAPEP